MAQTYKTRHLTARDNQLVDALERDPRYRRVAALLRPPHAKAPPAKPAPKAEVAAPAKPVPKAEPPKPGHTVEGMTMGNTDTAAKPSGR